MTQTPSFRDVQKLSAYLDGQLKPSEIARLESRLQTDSQLASILQDLRQTRSLLRRLPQRRAPRNFTLTPKMVGQKPPLPRTYPAFRFATVLATLLLFFTFATNFVAPRLDRVAAPYPYGIGGGGGGDAESELQMEAVPAAPLAPEEASQPAEGLAEEPAAEGEADSDEPVTPAEIPQPAPTELGTTANDSARAEPTLDAYEKSGVQSIPTGETFAQQTARDETPEPRPVKPLISPTVQIALAIVALLSGVAALFLRYSAIRKWRAKAK